MILTKHDMAQLAAAKESERSAQVRNSPPRRKGRSQHGSRRYQILNYPGRVVALTTVERRLKQWPKMTMHDACTIENMNHKE